MRVPFAVVFCRLQKGALLVMAPPLPPPSQDAELLSLFFEDAVAAVASLSHDALVQQARVTRRDEAEAEHAADEAAKTRALARIVLVASCGKLYLGTACEVDEVS